MPWLSLGQMLSHGHLTGLLASFLLLVSLVSTEQAKSTFENRCIVHFPILKFLGAPPHVLRLTSELTVAHGLSRLVLHHSYLSRAALSHPRVSAHTSLPQGSSVHGLLSAVTSPSWFSVISPFIMIDQSWGILTNTHSSSHSIIQTFGDRGMDKDRSLPLRKPCR